MPCSPNLSNEAYFSHPATVLEYARAAAGGVGLWESERLLCERFFPSDAPLLELGCGAGRIALALWRAGWRDITATDFSPAMLETAQAIVEEQAAHIAPPAAAPAPPPRFLFADATALPFDAGAFASVIFGFNGLMMIPGVARREQALREMRRVLRTGGAAIFTGHERDLPYRREHWLREGELWRVGARQPELECFGDCYHETPAGRMFIHVAARDETLALVERCGFEVLLCAMRSELAAEPPPVREFSDDTRFWVLRKPAEA